MENINNNPDKKWNWDNIRSYPNLTMEMINNNLDKPLDWYYISYNPNLIMEMINNNPDKPWNWNLISSNNFVFNRKIYCNKHKKTLFLLAIARQTSLLLLFLIFLNVPKMITNDKKVTANLFALR